MSMPRRMLEMPNAIPNISSYLGYCIYFWSNKNKPLEPVHVHISKSKPSKNALKYWINEDGSITNAEPSAKIDISKKDLKRIEDLIRTYSDDIINKWQTYFDISPQFYNAHDENSDFDEI